MATRIGTDDTDTLTGTPGADLLQALAGDDTLSGLAGNDRLLPGPGADRVDGGPGVDTVSSADRSGTVGIFLSLGGAVLAGDIESEDRITAVEDLEGSFSFDHMLGDARANLLQGLGGDDSLDGAGGDDTLLGGLGDDALYGGSGANLLDGGPGRDTVGFADADWDLADTTDLPIVADLAAGSYAVGGVVSRVSDVEGAYGGYANDVLRGDSADNDLIAGPGRDTLRGGGGEDLLWGREGTDTLFGGAGDDTLDSYFGDVDTVDGGAGNDLLLLDDDGDRVTGGPGADQFGFGSTSSRDTGRPLFTVRDFDVAGGDVLDLSRYATLADGRDTIVPIRFIGQAAFGPDDVPAVRYAPTADGDTLVQFTDPDSFRLGIETVHEILLEGRKALTADDFLLAGVSSSDAGDRLTGTAYADDLNGRGGDDVIRGLAGKDWIEGEDGADDLDGGAGADFVRGGAGVDVLRGGAGDDDVHDGYEDAGADRIFGGPGDDELEGGAGDDRLAGGVGVDRLLGGTGADLFAFAGSATGVGADRRDVVRDFEPGDRLDLRPIDADTVTAGDQAFVFIGTRAFSAPGQLRVATPEATLVQGSWDADPAPELEIELAGRHALSASDFLL